MKKCSDRTCKETAQYAKVGADGAYCARHAPLHIAPLNDLDELPSGGWNHVDAMRKCDNCGFWSTEGDCLRQSCDTHITCSECDAGDELCVLCKDAADERADVLGVIGSA